MEKKRDTQKVYAAFAGKTKQELLNFLHSTDNGMEEEQIKEAREKYGENSISYGKKTPFIVEVLKAYITPFTLVLIALGVISFITEYLLAAPEEKDLFGRDASYHAGAVKAKRHDAELSGHYFRTKSPQRFF